MCGPCLLLQVVHNLNTKLDDSESELQCLKSQHEKELQLIEEEKSTKVKLWEEERTLVAILQTQITSLEAEKEKLNQEKVCAMSLLYIAAYTYTKLKIYKITELV